MNAKLNLTEQGRLIELEQEISEGLSHTLRVAKALHEIRTKALYRSQDKSFEDYCLRRWGLKKSQAYRLIEFWEIRQDLSPIGENENSEKNLPDREAQARPLAGLPPEQRQAAWDRACNDAGGRQPTGEEVERAATLERLSRKALAGLPAAKQLEILQAGEKENLARADQRRRQEERDVEQTRRERLKHHVERAIDFARVLGEQSALDTLTEVLAGLEQREAA